MLRPFLFSQLGGPCKVAFDCGVQAWVQDDACRFGIRRGFSLTRACCCRQYLVFGFCKNRISKGIWNCIYVLCFGGLQV